MSSSKVRRAVGVIGLLCMGALAACGSSKETTLPLNGAAPVGSTAPGSTAPLGTAPGTTPGTAAESSTTVFATTKPTPKPTTKPTVKPTVKPPAPTTARPTTTVFAAPTTTAKPVDPVCASLKPFQATNLGAVAFPTAFNEWLQALQSVSGTAPPEVAPALNVIVTNFQNAKPLVDSGQIQNKDQLFSWLQQQGPDISTAIGTVANVYRQKCL